MPPARGDLGYPALPLHPAPALHPAPTPDPSREWFRDSFCLHAAHGTQEAYFSIQLWNKPISWKKEKKKSFTSVARTGIEPATLALLAPRSNQLS